MVRLLRGVSWALLVLCAAACLAWFVADRYAASWLDRQLEGLHLSAVVSAERAHLPAPDTVVLEDARLLDETTGQQVGAVDRVELRLGLPGRGDWDSVRPLLLSGRGGRVLMSLDGDELVFARAIETLLDHVHEVLAERRGPRERRPSADRRAFLPPMEFRDVEITLRAPGLPDHVAPGCDAFLQLRSDGTFAVDIDIGRDGGHVLLEFGEHGLARVQTRRLAIQPAFGMFLPGQRRLVAEAVAPEGLLDLDARGFADEFPHASGMLREGTLRPPLAPFPITQVTLPFELRDGHVRVEDAQLSFDGGSALASFDHGPEGLGWDLDIVDADFRRSYLELLPDSLDLAWIDPDDGGNLELHLHVEQPADGPAVLAGSGGLLVRKLRLGPTRVEVDDMVSRFELRDRVLVFHEASGHCAGGVVSVKGQVDVASGDVDGRASVFDVDIARVRRALDMGGEQQPVANGGRPVSGWLQGEVAYDGRIGDPGRARGRGQFSVRGGNLWRVPVLDAILGALRLTDPGTSERHRLGVVFDIVGRRYDVHMFKLESPFLSLVGDGKLNRDGTLEIDIVPIKVPLGYVGDLIEYIQSQVVRLELRGTLSEPDVRVVPVRVVTRNVGRFWDWLGGLFSSEPEPAGPPFDALPLLPPAPPDESPEGSDELPADTPAEPPADTTGESPADTTGESPADAPAEPPVGTQQGAAQRP